MNVLFGMPVIHETGGFGGEIYLDGEKTIIASPHDAMTKGIGMVHQEFMLLPGFTITENIKLNREITRPTILSRALHLKNMENLDMPAMRKDARKAKNWAESDRIRDELKAQGILVEDTPQGMKWKRI